MPFVLAKRYNGEKQDRYFQGDVWGMAGEQYLKDAYVFSSFDEIVTSIANQVRRYPNFAYASGDVCKLLEVDIVAITPPVSPQAVKIIREVK